MGDPVIHIRGLKKRFGDIVALDGLDMQVNPGDIYGFLGPNGSGKSTTIRIIMSLVRADAGEIRIFGLPLERSRNQVLMKVGALIERPDFYGHLSAKTNLSILAKYSKVRVHSREIYALLELVGLKDREDDRVSSFSDGMKQRLGIAQAIIHKPDLLVLDEPFNSLDPQGVKDVRDLIRRLNMENKVTIMISSHQLDEIEKLATRLVVISRGKAVTEGPMKTLLTQSAAKIHLRVNDAEKAGEILQNQKVPVEAIDPAAGRIIISSQLAEVPALNELLVRQGIRIYELKPDQSLESLFLDYTAKT